MRSILLRKFKGSYNYYLNTALNPQCIDVFKRLFYKRKAEIKYLHTNMVPFGIHKYLPQPVDYITIVRHPVDREISEYYYIIRTPSHPAHYAVKELRFQDYVTSGVLASQVQNTQTRIISGVGGAYQIFGYEKTLTSLDLQRAKANIEKRYLLVGLFERFDETMVLLKRALGWSMRDIFYRRQNVGNNRPSVDKVAGHIINDIERYNKLDFELYAYAMQLFEKRIAEQGSSFGRELLLFRFCNKIYGHFNRTRLLEIYGRIMGIGK